MLNYHSEWSRLRPVEYGTREHIWKREDWTVRDKASYKFMIITTELEDWQESSTQKAREWHESGMRKAWEHNRTSAHHRRHDEFTKGVHCSAYEDAPAALG